MYREKERKRAIKRSERKRDLYRERDREIERKRAINRANKQRN